MSSQGDMRAYKAYHDNQWSETKKEINPKESKKVENAGLLAATGGDLSDPNVKSKGKPISQNQIGRMMAIAKKAGFTDDGLNRLVAEYGYTSKKDITFTYDGGDYAAICERLTEELAPKYNATPIAELPPGLRPQNSTVFATLIKILGFEQARFDFYFSRAFPGLSADMLTAEQTNQAIKAVCKAFAQDNTEASAAIDNAIIGKASLGVPLKDCLTQWQQNYGLPVLQVRN
ncbi:hypothetical protein DP117_35425 [Brasilonema sp. UFV-L1]|nr:hypothetical protein [Brasilonema sp. UFV-L1]